MRPGSDERTRAGPRGDAGAEEIETQVTRRDDYAPLAGNADDQLYLGTELSFVATGRPALGVGAPVSSI